MRTRDARQGDLFSQPVKLMPAAPAKSDPREPTIMDYLASLPPKSRAPGA
jgi:hypothetical protein